MGRRGRNPPGTRSARFTRTPWASTREMDEIVWAVNPEYYTLESLVNYLCRYAQTFLSAAHLRAAGTCRWIFLHGWYTPDIRHNLFLAFKEALNNIVKHSGASEVRVTIDLLPAELRLELRDDGRGLQGSLATVAGPDSENPDRIASGLGLDGIRRRLTRLGGGSKSGALWTRAPPVSFGCRSKPCLPAGLRPGDHPEEQGDCGRPGACDCRRLASPRSSEGGLISPVSKRASAWG